MSDQLCTYLEWDTKFFGVRIARVNRSRLSSADMEEILSWCRAQAIECVYFLADPNDVETICVAEDSSFRLVDIRVTLEWRGVDPGPSCASACVRLWQPGDLPALRAIASTIYTDSRFYFDPHFVDRAASLYCTWITKSTQGYADVIWVAKLDGQPVGYISCHLEDDGSGKIGLVGVSPSVQGQDVGKALVQHSLAWFVDHAVRRVRVVTQGRNVAAQRLYQQYGFVTEKVQLWYHKWFQVSDRSEGE